MINERMAKRYCKDNISLIENYEQAVNDPINKWVVHHRRETIYSMEGLKEIGEYYHRPAIELIFMLKGEHARFHHIGKNHSEKAKKKMSESHIGKRHSDKSKKKMSESHIGKRHSDKSKKKMSESQMGNHNAPTKPIIQYTKDGEFIKEWTSGIEAYKVLGIHRGNITSCCKGKRNYAGGFVWRYR